MQGTVATEREAARIAEALSNRTEKVHSHFKQALAVDDFLARVEVRALQSCSLICIPNNGLSVIDVCLARSGCKYIVP